MNTNGSRVRTKNRAIYEKFTQKMTILHKPLELKKMDSEVSPEILTPCKKSWLSFRSTVKGIRFLRTLTSTRIEVEPW